MAVPPEFIEDLRQRVPLSDVIGRRVKLVRKGRRLSGLCPFHSEKTPSFSVVDDDGFFVFCHCRFLSDYSAAQGIPLLCAVLRAT